MREIKFRAWDKANKRMGHFKPGFVWCDEYYTWDLSPDGEPDIMDVPPGDNIEFMQFTGLKDKNGKEIYEGDWCRFTLRGTIFQTQQGVIQYVGSAFRAHINDMDDSLTIDRYYEIEVIGNIYENPELLNK